jgi:hypothetical protein
MNPKVFMNPRECDTYFICNKDCVGMVSFSSIQKCTASLRVLAYGAPSDTHEHYLRMAESTTMVYVQVRQGSGAVFEPTYLKIPNAEDTAGVLPHSTSREIPGMLGRRTVHFLTKNMQRS